MMMSKIALLFVLLSTATTVNSFTIPTSNNVTPTQNNANALYMNHNDNEENNNNNNNDNNTINDEITRDSFFVELVQKTAFVSTVFGVKNQPVFAESRPETMDVDNFLRTGMETG